MHSVAGIQAALRGALLTGRTSGLRELLQGGVHPEKRLAIHQRHYRTSLVTSLVDRFPATVWLVGSEFVGTAAEAFVSRVPPSRPCIAEYGEDFPAFLAERPEADALPYLEQFSTLEWHLARVSLAVDLPPATLSDLHAVVPDGLTDARFDLQPGLHYVRLDWVLDDLIGLYLTDQSPESFALTPGPVFLEVHGSRGELRMTRLAAAVFAFRRALSTGAILAAALAAAVAADPTFDPGQALGEILNLSLIAAVRPPGPRASIEVAQ